MNREWLVFHLSKPSWIDHERYPALAIRDVVSAMVGHLRSADAEGRWSFQHHADGRGPVMEVRFHATPAVIGELEHGLLRRTGERGWPVSVVPAPGAARAVPEQRRPGTAARLSALSCDVALDLLAAGGLEPQDHAGAAAAHLRVLIEAVAAAERAGFLFECWRHWSRDCTPEGRLELVGLSEAPQPQADYELPWHCDADDGGERAAAWSQYLTAVAAVLREHPAHDPEPIKYVLFEHAQLTHNRLGIAAGRAALAALTLRRAVVAGL